MTALVHDLQVSGVASAPLPHVPPALEPQVEVLRKHPHIIVATPGRLLDLVDDHLLRISSNASADAAGAPLEAAAGGGAGAAHGSDSSSSACQGGMMYVVLDEADKMLSLGFQPQLERLRGMLLPSGGANRAGAEKKKAKKTQQQQQQQQQTGWGKRPQVGELPCRRPRCGNASFLGRFFHMRLLRSNCIKVSLLLLFSRCPLLSLPVRFPSTSSPPSFLFVPPFVISLSLPRPTPPPAPCRCSCSRRPCPRRPPQLLPAGCCPQRTAWQYLVAPRLLPSAAQSRRCALVYVCACTCVCVCTRVRSCGG